MLFYLFTGNSGLYLTNWQSRLFYIFAIPLGLALYLVIIISLAYHIHDAMRSYIFALEKRVDVNNINMKILLVSFASCVFAVQFGTLPAIMAHRTYLYGLYLSTDVMTFVGNEALLQRGQSMKMYYSLPLSLFLMLQHSLLLVFIASCCLVWKEISESCEPLDCCNPEPQPLSHDYKAKLLASFEHTDSPPNEASAEDEMYFPQMKGYEMKYDLDVVTCAQAEQHDGSRFSEMFYGNAQKNNLDTIDESGEEFDTGALETSSQISAEETLLKKAKKQVEDKVGGIDGVDAENADLVQHHDSLKESGHNEPVVENLTGIGANDPLEGPLDASEAQDGHFDGGLVGLTNNQSPNDSGSDKSPEEEVNERLRRFFMGSGSHEPDNQHLTDSGATDPLEGLASASGPNSFSASGASSPTPSLPSSYSNISIDSFGEPDAESENETLSGTRLSRELDSLLGDLDTTVTEKQNR